MDQWLALLILGDLDPYTPTITPRVSLPTRSTKSRIAGADVFTVQTFIQTLNSSIMDIFSDTTGRTPGVKYELAGSKVAENRRIIDPWAVKFSGLLKD